MQPPLTPSGLKFKLSVAVESQGLGLQLGDEEGRVGTFAAYLIRTKLAAGGYQGVSWSKSGMLSYK